MDNAVNCPKPVYLPQTSHKQLQWPSPCKWPPGGYLRWVRWLSRIRILTVIWLFWSERSACAALAEGLACADPGARTPIGVSGNFLGIFFFLHSPFCRAEGLCQHAAFKESGKWGCLEFRAVIGRHGSWGLSCLSSHWLVQIYRF
jgi:hypothetical protein